MTTRSIRARLAELTVGARSQVDLDEIVARAGGLGALFRAEFPNGDPGEFSHEWENVKLTIQREV